MEDRKCAECGKWFTPKQANQVTCSPCCSYERRKRTAREYQYRKKKCVICGKEFAPNTPSRICCSGECSKERNKMFTKIRKMKKKKGITKKRCANCGEYFETKTDSVRYCSDICRDMARRLQYETYAEKRKKEKPEPTVANTCPKDCAYRGQISGTVTCDYSLITGEVRGGDVTTCKVYKKGKKKDRKWKAMPVPGWY